MLEVDPKLRITAEEALNHSFFDEGEVKTKKYQQLEKDCSRLKSIIYNDEDIIEDE